MIIVKAKIREYAKDFNVAGDVAQKLNDKVIQLINEGCKRARENKRTTLMGKDI